MVDSKEAVEFLTDCPVARIVVIIDTHCVEGNGAFIWGSDRDGGYKACSLQEVRPCKILNQRLLTFAKLLTDCIPKNVHQFLLKSSKRVYHNRSIIANLACGASVQNDESRESLCRGYVRQVVTIGSYLHIPSVMMRRQFCH